MKKTKDFFIIPFNSAKIKNKYLVSNRLGAWDFLDPKEFKEFSGLRITRQTPFFERLKEKGLVADESNINSLLQDFRNAHANLYRDAALHIAVVTTRCNQECSYCQTRVQDPANMTVPVALEVLNRLFEVRSKKVVLEFQGGEPLLVWPLVSSMIFGARHMNRNAVKDLSIVMVSNLLLLDEEKMKVLVDHNVDLCTSLDGPQKIHDKNRIMTGGKGTYKQVIAKIKWIKDKFKRNVGLLPTITKHSLKDPKGLIDEYVSLGQREIHLRPANNMGGASCVWRDVGYSPEDFCSFYARAMEYILALNRKGIFLRERMAALILTRVLGKKDTGYVDLMNPCGAGRSVMAYMPDGVCYPCDEARMLGDDMFKLGNVLTEKYEDMVKKGSLLHLLQASCSDLWNYGSVYSPWVGVCPVVNYAVHKNFVPKVCSSPMTRIMTFQHKYVFEKMLDEHGTADIFNRWVEEKTNVR